MNISEFEVIDHGIEHEQYFQGCGTTFTEFTDCFTGVGCSGYDALDDALECAAQAGWEYQSYQEERMFTHVSHQIDKVFLEEEPSADGLWHYVSVRVR